MVGCVDRCGGADVLIIVRATARCRRTSATWLSATCVFRRTGSVSRPPYPSGEPRHRSGDAEPAHSDDGRDDPECDRDQAGNPLFKATRASACDLSTWRAQGLSFDEEQHTNRTATVSDVSFAGMGGTSRSRTCSSRRTLDMTLDKVTQARDIRLLIGKNAHVPTARPPWPRATGCRRSRAIPSRNVRNRTPAASGNPTVKNRESRGKRFGVWDLAKAKQGHPPLLDAVHRPGRAGPSRPKRASPRPSTGAARRP